MEHYSLSEFNSLVKATLSDHLDPSYWIVAEIGELNMHRNGHCYLELVEKENQRIQSKIRATIWAYTFSGIHNFFINTTGSPLAPGMKILLNASLEYHEIYGLSLNIKDIDPNFTLGEREKTRQETIQRLKKEGFLQLNKQLTLPLVAQRIAIISSETAAGYQDFMNQFHHNPYGYKAEFELFNATMQGNTAAESIELALEQIDPTTFDLIVVIRGGGAKMDLDCFDEYELCVAFAEAEIPVITGIGHERDQTILDLVAHTSLKTPTAVAEFLISGMMQFEQTIIELDQRVDRCVSDQLADTKYSLERLSEVILRRPKDIIKWQKMKLESLASLLHSSEPRRVLERGFTLTKVNGKYLKGGDKIKPGTELETITARQTIISKVESTHE